MKDYSSVRETDDTCTPTSNNESTRIYPVELDAPEEQHYQVSSREEAREAFVGDNILTISIDDAIERIRMGKFQRNILIAAGLCFSADATEILLLSFLTIVLQNQWDLSEEQTSSITFSVFMGALFGSMILGPLGDWIGRRPIFSAAALIITVFGMLTAVAESYAALVFMRFIVGFGVGGLTVPFDALAEFLPTSTRGKNLLAVEYFWTGGSLLVPAFAYITLGNSQDDPTSWQTFVVLCAIPCMASSIMGFFVVPESPRWLIARGRPTAALAILRRAARKNQLDPMEVFPEGTQLTAAAEDHSNVCDLFTPQWKWITLCLWGAWAGFAFLYYGNVIAITLVFSGQDSTRDGTGEASSYNFDYGAIFVSSFAEVVGTTIVILTIDRFGRIPSQTVSYVMGGISIFLMCLFSWMNAGRGVLMTFSFMARLFMMSATCTTWVSTSEILTTEIRTTGHSAANAIARIGGAVSPFLVTESTPLLRIGIVMLSLSLFVALCVVRLPETTGLALGAAAPHVHDVVDPVAKEHEEAEATSSRPTITARAIL